MQGDLISRSAAIEALNQHSYETISDYDKTVELLNEIPTVDAVPVVRCKSCMRRRTFECPMYSETDGSDYGLGIIINDRTDDDGYCHCGARMDGEEDANGYQTD